MSLAPVIAPAAPRPSLADRLADGFTWAVVLLVGLAHLLFILHDVRIPQDLGQYYTRVPGIFHALGSPAELLSELSATLPTPGGWMQVFVAVFLRVVGRSPWSFQVLDLAWVLLSVALAARIARHLAGPRAACMAAAVLGSIPMIVIQGRMGWIHLPELALILGILLAWLADPALRYRRTVAIMAVLGLLAVTLRPSAFAWVGSEGLLLGATLWQDRSRRKILRVGVILLAWAVGVAFMADDLPLYLSAKMAARERYETAVPELLLQFRVGIGMPALVLGAFGLLFGLVRRPYVPSLVLLAWAGSPLVLTALFGAGLDNFPLFCASLAILAGRAAASSIRWVTWLALPLAVLAQAPALLPDLSPASPFAQFLVRAGYNLRSAIEDYRVVYRGVGDREFLALIDATCPDPGTPCDIMVDQGLFRPFAEDPGHLQLFLARYDHVHIWESRMPAKALEGLVFEGMVEYDCGQSDLPWRSRYPYSLDNVFAAIDGSQLAPAWSGLWSTSCSVIWMAPGGILPDPDLVRGTWGARMAPPPPGSRRPEAGSETHPVVHPGVWQDDTDPSLHAPGRERDER